MASSNNGQYGAKPFWNAEGFTPACFQVAAALQNLQRLVQLQLRELAHCAEQCWPIAKPFLTQSNWSINMFIFLAHMQ